MNSQILAEVSAMPVTRLAEASPDLLQKAQIAAMNAPAPEPQPEPKKMKRVKKADSLKKLGELVA